MRSHIHHLDRAIVQLVDERARLVRQLASEGASTATEPFVDDLLRRADGDCPAAELRAVFEAIDRGCRGAAEGRR